MALSNWDTLAIDETGASISGSFVSPLGVRVEFYKNWLYVYDEKAYQEGGTFTNSCVMEVQSGDITYKDVVISAVRGPQGGIYAQVSTQWYKDDRKIMVGCGVYGYEYPPAPCGHDANILGSRSSTGKDGKWITRCVECEQIIPDCKWVGVLPESLEFLRNMVLEFVPDYLSKEQQDNHINTKLANALSTALRFNQGDAFFATAYGEDIPATAPGEVNRPMIETLIGIDGTPCDS